MKKPGAGKTFQQSERNNAHVEQHSQGKGDFIRDIILGGQDGLVNVLGIILGVATATSDTRIVLISGLAATFAESISMGAVAYSSTKAQKQYYESQMQREIYEIETMPEKEKQEIYDIYYAKGFRGRELKQIVRRITSDKKLWLNEMMEQELKLSPADNTNPVKSGWVVFASAMVGSLIPLLPFFFMNLKTASAIAVVVSAIALFAAGAWKAKITVGSQWKNGLEMAIVGTVAAVLGYLIGKILGAAPF